MTLAPFTHTSTTRTLSCTHLYGCTPLLVFGYRYGCDFVASVGNDYDPDTLQGIPPAITQQRGHLYYDVYMDGSQVPFYALIGDKYKEYACMCVCVLVWALSLQRQ